MGDKWRQRSSHSEHLEDELGVKGPSSSHSRDSKEHSSNRDESPSHDKHKKKHHHHHHKRHKKDRKRSKSPSHSRKRSRSRSRSRESQDRGHHRLHGSRPGRSDDRHCKDYNDHNVRSSHRSVDRFPRSHSGSRDVDRFERRKTGDRQDYGGVESITASRNSTIQPLMSSKGLPAEAAKLKEEVERRKQLWSKKDKPTEGNPSVWKQPAFTGDNDGKVSAKFKRLMGIKEDQSKGSGNTSSKAGTDQHGQQEYFANLEKQYEVARATTHTQRGVGLGFSTGFRILPR